MPISPQSTIALADEYLKSLSSVLEKLDRDEIRQLVDVLDDARLKGNTIYICGNGGSASTASHMVCDLNKGACYHSQEKFRAVSLSDNVPTMMALANDVDYKDIFVEPLKNFMKAGDVVIGISGSGNSPNVLKAIEYANAHEGVTVGLTGYQGGKLKDMAAYSVNVRYNDMQISEDVHLILGHILMKIFCGALPSEKVAGYV